MKKLILILVTAIILIAGAITAILLLTGDSEPEHTHSYSADWKNDAESHWHACTGDGCAEISNKATHTWNSGTITTEATAQKEGEKTYQCTICTAKKTEPVAFEGVDEETWSLMIADHNFENYTFTQYGYTVQNDITESVQSGTIKITADKIKIDVTIEMKKQFGEPVTEDPIDISEQFDEPATVKMYKSQYEQIFRALLAEYESYVWDADKKVYKNPNAINTSFNMDAAVPGANAQVTMTDGKVTLDADGRLVKFDCKYTQTLNIPGQETIITETDASWSFSDFGTTVIE